MYVTCLLLTRFVATANDFKLSSVEWCDNYHRMNVEAR